jgi:DNA replication protein DnaC
MGTCQHPRCDNDTTYPFIARKNGASKRFFFCAEHLEEAKEKLKARKRREDPADRIEALFGEKFRDATFKTYRTEKETLKRLAAPIRERQSEPVITEEDLQTLRDTKSSMKSFTAQMMKTGEGTVFLSGPNGVGKTHLVAASTRKLIQKGMTVSAWHATRLLTNIRATYSAAPAEERRTVDRLIESMTDSDVLVLQDIRESCFADDIKDYMFEIVDRVYRGQSILMITSNFSLEELMHPDRLGKPFMSRILEPPSCVKKMKGLSFRRMSKAYQTTKLNE